jgi:signal transduction histidine kinase
MPPLSAEQKAALQFEILRDIVLSASVETNISDTAQAALRGASRLVGLTAATMILWDDKESPILSVSHFEKETERKVLEELEQELYAGLRKNRKLVAAYLSFGGENPSASFTLPLRKGEKILGAVIGIQPGIGTLVREDIFLETLTAALAVASIAGGFGTTEDTAARIKRERINAIMETAATVNHEINNPLTAVLGNVQLLLLRRDDLDEDLKKKLKAVEESALRIKEVTQKLMKITQDKITDYTDGIKMIDLSDEDKG